MPNSYETTNKHQKNTSYSIAKDVAQQSPTSFSNTSKVASYAPPPFQLSANMDMEEHTGFENEPTNYLLTIGASSTPNDSADDDANENSSGQYNSGSFQVPPSPSVQAPPTAMAARKPEDNNTKGSDPPTEPETENPADDQPSSGSDQAEDDNTQDAPPTETEGTTDNQPSSGNDQAESHSAVPHHNAHTQTETNNAEETNNTDFVYNNVGAYLNEMAKPAIQSGRMNISRLAANEKQTESALVKLNRTEKAVVVPPAEGQSKSNNKQVIKVAQKPQPSTSEIMAKIKYQLKLQTVLPTTLGEVDEFKESGKAQQIMTSAKEIINVDVNNIDNTYNEISYPPVPETPTSPTPLGKPKPPLKTDALNLGADMIVPLLPEHTDFTAYEKEADETLEKEGITDMHLDMVNAGELLEVKKGKTQMKEIVSNAPPKIEEIRIQSIKQADQQLNQEDQKGRNKMRQIREKELDNIKQEQEQTKTKFEQTREEVSDEINRIYNTAKTNVALKLWVLNNQTLPDFEVGQEVATKTFEDNVDRRIKAFKKERHSGVFGWIKKGWDWLTGIADLPEVKEILDSERTLFINTIDTLIANITAKNKRTIEECRMVVAEAKTKIAAYVDRLSPELKAIGEQAQEDIQVKLNQLDEKINRKEEEMAQLLELKKQEAIQMIDEKIEELKEKMSGVMSVIFKFLGELALKFLRWALNSVGLDADAFIDAIKNIGEAIVKIIKNPVAFFKNLVAAVTGGFKEFFGNAAQNLFNVLIEWITNGAAGNLVLPTEWTLKNILKMVLDFFNIGWQSIKGMFAEQLGPAVVDYAIGAAQLVQNIIKDGPIAIWNMIKGHASDGWGYAKEKMAEKIGQDKVDKIEMFADLLQRLVSEGPIALWEFIKEKGSELIETIKKMIIDALIDWGITKILKKGIEFLFTIATGFIAAIKAIYDAVMTFFKKRATLAALIKALLGTLMDAAAGNVGAGISKISAAIPMVLSVLLDLLARMLGISDVPAAIGKAIDTAVNSVQDFIKKAVKWVADLLKGIWEKVKGWFTRDDKEESSEVSYENDPEKTAKVNEAIKDLKQEEKTYIKDEKIKQQDAQKVADNVKTKHPVINSLLVKDGANVQEQGIESIEQYFVYEIIASPAKYVKSGRKDGPELEEYEGEAINKNGRISSPTNDYERVASQGVRVREVPSPEGTELGRLKYNSSIHIKCKNKSDTGWVFIISDEGLAGWVNANYVAESPPEPSATLYHVKAYPDCYKDIFAFYKKEGYSPEIGKDDKHILMSLVIANHGREGVSINETKFNESLSNNSIVNIFDNQDENRAIYQSVELKAGHNIWLHSWSHVESLINSGIIATRSDWMNAGIEVGKGVVAFSDGVITGFFGGIWDALTGLWDMGGQIIQTIGKIVTGEIAKDVENIFSFIKDLTPEKAKGIVQSIVKSVIQGAGNFINSWNNDNFYDKWEFRGRIVGAVLLEVVLAVFTGGIGNAAKWLGKLGKYAPKLANALRKIIDKVEDVIPDKMKPRNGDTDAEFMDFEKQQALLLAKTITEAHDAKDSSIAVLEASLAIVKRKYSVVKRFDVDAIPGQPGHYTVTMIASKGNVDKDYTPGENDSAAKALKLKEKWNDWTESEIEDYYKLTKNSKDRDMSSNSADHKAQRWQDYKDRNGEWTYERWQKQYHTNMSNAKKIEREDFYKKLLGDGIKPKRIKTPFTYRDLDIQKPNTKKMYEVKTGKEYLSTAKSSTKLDNETRIKKDKFLVSQNYEITWILEQGGSQPLLEALKNAGIKYIIGKPSKLD